MSAQPPVCPTCSTLCLPFLDQPPPLLPLLPLLSLLLITALRFLKFAWEPINSILSFWVAVFFHAAFAWSSQGGFLPYPMFPIVTKNAMFTVHGSR